MSTTDIPDLELALYRVWKYHPDYATRDWAHSLLRERWARNPLKLGGVG